MTSLKRLLVLLVGLVAMTAFAAGCIVDNDGEDGDGTDVNVDDGGDGDDGDTTVVEDDDDPDNIFVDVEQDNGGNETS